MTTRQSPPKVVEALARLLLPPACREAVLGDLSERYSNPKQYTKAAFQTVPWVIASQIRRTSQREQALSEFCALYVAFYLAALWSLGSGLLLEHAKWLLLIPPAVAGTIGLVLRQAYSTPGKRSPRKAFIDASFGVGFSYLSWALLLIAAPAYVLPVETMIGAGIFSLHMIVMLRTFRQENSGLHQARLASGAWNPAHRRAQELQEKVWWVSIVWFVVLSALHNFDPRFGRGTFPVLAQLAIGFAFAAMYKKRLIDMGQLDIGQGDDAVTINPAAYCIRVQRQRDTLRNWSAYQGPLITAMTTIPLCLGFLMWLFGFRVDKAFGPVLWTFTIPLMALSVVLFFLQRKLTRQAAAALQEELDALDISHDNQP